MIQNFKDAVEQIFHFLFSLIPDKISRTPVYPYGQSQESGQASLYFLRQSLSQCGTPRSRVDSTGKKRLKVPVIIHLVCQLEEIKIFLDLIFLKRYNK